MYQVVKRDGKVVDFDLSKIGAAITKAFEAQNRQYTQSIIDLLALRATADYEKKIKDGLVHVEDIQDSVEACWSRPATPTSPRAISFTASSARRSAI